MTLAMLPLALISIYQTREVLGEAQTITNTALLAKTVAAATAERELIQNAVGASQALATVVAQGADDCPRVMSEFVDHNPTYIFAGFLEADGALRHSSRGEEVNFGVSPALAEAIASDGPLIIMNETG